MVFIFFRGASLKNWMFYYTAEYLLASVTDVLITINNEDYGLAQKKMNAGQVFYIPGIGVDHKQEIMSGLERRALRTALGVQEDEIMLLSVGELTANKNHRSTLAAVNLLKDKNIKYLICGRGKLEEELRREIADKGLSERVKLLGYRSDIRKILRAADIFIFPSYREGLSVALMEAMAAGLPIVCSDIRGNVDLVDGGKGGYLVKPGDIQTWAERIGDLIDDLDKRRRFGEYNKEKVLYFSSEKVNQVMKRIYQETLV